MCFLKGRRNFREKKIQAEGRKKWEHLWSREEWRGMREAGEGYLGSSCADSASASVCHTEFALQQSQGCDQIEKKHRNTQASSERVRESRGIKDDAETVKCC